MVDDLVNMYDNINEEMQMNNLSLENKQEIVGEMIGEVQNNSFKSEFGNIINSALDFGIRALCPDIVEDQIINLKDNIFNYGFKEGLGKTVEDIVNFGKSALGLITNAFENLTQAHTAISSGGTLDKVSYLLDKGIDGVEKNNLVSTEITTNLKEGKDIILKNVEEGIENSFANQFENLEKLEKYISSWNKNFEAQNFSGMERAFNKMRTTMDSLLPMENTLNDYRTIENLHTLIKNNGKNFDLSADEMQLANKLIH